MLQYQGPFAYIREQVDHEYHGHYSKAATARVTVRVRGQVGTYTVRQRAVVFDELRIRVWG